MARESIVAMTNDRDHDDGPAGHPAQETCCCTGFITVEVGMPT